MNLHVPRGFKFGGVHCGIKLDASREDLSLIVADAPCVAAGVYTQNLVYAAPVAVDRRRTPADHIRVVVTNYGNANACTGPRGERDAEEMCRLAAEAVGARAEQALVMSTGIIGKFLPMDRIAAGVRAAAAQLGDSPESFLAAARGITTTDKSHKVASRELRAAGQTWHVTGIAKGAGMIGPNMATLLAVVLTDAALTVSDAQAALVAAVTDSFNCISVEGHTSTNDTLLLLASGAGSDRPLGGAALGEFGGVLRDVCIDLARQIADDGEGASHLITIDVEGCATRQDAFRIAKTVAESALVKTAIAGADPNWGRIVSAAGYACVRFDPARLQLRLNGTLLFRDGAPVAFDAPAVSRSLRENRETQVVLQLVEGAARVRFWTSDLNEKYVKFNADYHT